MAATEWLYLEHTTWSTGSIIQTLGWSFEKDNHTACAEKSKYSFTFD